uniref:Hyaluronidase n=1 Tax=Onchocerca volvulus TaxID=6282 RepID=A0A8R1TLZ9_ONCVO
MVQLLFQLLIIIWLILVSARQWNQFEQLTETKLIEEYGILVNDGHKFHGNIIVNLYEKKFGLYPYYRNYSDPSSSVNGGIPQLANISAHLSKVYSDITKAIPNLNFDGLAVIDYENWRPLWEQNYHTKRIYQSESVAYVKKRYGNINDSAAKLIAMNEFNNASMEFLLATIRLAKEMRPNAFAGKNNIAECGEVFEEFNNRLQPLYNETDALYPSIYLRKKKNSSADCLYVTSMIKEAKRSTKNLNPNMPIFAFTSIEYLPLNLSDPSYYSERDLRNSLRQVFYMDIQGSTSNDMEKRCEDIADYFREYFAPEVAKLKKFAKACASIKNNE